MQVEAPVRERQDPQVAAEVNIVLPYPPSVNSLYRTFRGRMLISKRGREWMKLAVHEAKTQAAGWFVNGACSIEIRAYVPDNRRRDIDNIGKGLFDCITHAGIWKDDCQVKDMRITHCGIDRINPRCEVTVLPL